MFNRLASFLHLVLLLSLLQVYAAAPAVTCVEHWATSAEASHHRRSEIAYPHTHLPAVETRAPTPDYMKVAGLPDCRLEAPATNQQLLLTVSESFLPSAVRPGRVERSEAELGLAEQPTTYFHIISVESPPPIAV